MSKKRSIKTIDSKSTTAQLPSPLKVGECVETLFGTVIRIEEARTFDKNIMLDCTVLRHGYDGPRHNHKVQMQIGLDEDIHNSRSPFSMCRAIPCPTV
jgi:hypothetical protein